MFGTGAMRTIVLPAMVTLEPSQKMGLQASRKRLEAIDWVEWATVERRLPDTLYVTLKERRAVAIWQNGSEYTLIDANVAYTNPTGDWTLTLWGKNLTDEEYRIGGYNFPGAYTFNNSIIGYYGPPQTVSAMLQVKF